MRWEPLKPRRILALDPGRRGIGFAVFDCEPLQLKDWGIKVVRQRDEWLRVDKALRLVGLYNPDVVVFEDWRRTLPSRRENLKTFATSFELELLDRYIDIATYSSGEARQLFSAIGASTKHDIAKVIVARFPELLWRLGEPRRIWLPEDHYMGVFDAVAFALTHLDAEDRRLTVNGP